MNSRENRIALIPARLESTRLPEKLLLPLGNKAIIVRTYEAVVATQLFKRVIIVCNNTRIAKVLQENGCEYLLDQTHYESGTDRIAAIAQKLPEDIIINIQGDEPFISKNDISKLINLFDNKSIEVASLKTKLHNTTDINNPNNVKVVTNKEGRALYFSRSPIPYSRDNAAVTFFKHLGIYGYRRDTLLKITTLEPSPLEKIEKLENLRMLENNIDIYLAAVENTMPSIDTAADYQQAVKLWQVEK